MPTLFDLTTEALALESILETMGGEIPDADALAAEKLRERLKLFFERTGKSRVETARFRISLVSNGGKVPLRLHCPPEQLPEDFRRTVTTYRADQDAIRAALEAGEHLVFASLEERGTSLRIK